MSPLKTNAGLNNNGNASSSTIVSILQKHKFSLGKKFTTKFIIIKVNSELWKKNGTQKRFTYDTMLINMSHFLISRGNIIKLSNCEEKGGKYRI